MKKLLWYVGIGLIIAVMVPLTLILLPLILVTNILNVPIRKRQMKKLHERVLNVWIPKQKYLHLTYDANTPFAQIVESRLIPKYGRFIIADKWEPKERKWVHGWGDNYDKVDNVVMEAIVEDCCGVNFCIAEVSPATRFFEEPDKMLHLFFDESTGEIIDSATDKPITLEAVERKAEKKVQSCLAGWGVKLV